MYATRLSMADCENLPANLAATAFSSEVETGSRKENASKQESSTDYPRSVSRLLPMLRDACFASSSEGENVSLSPGEFLHLMGSKTATAKLFG
jgi:hypothetical protein